MPNEDEDFQKAAKLVLTTILLAVAMLCFTTVAVVWMLTK